MQKGKSKKMLIFLDLETTGTNNDDKVCSIATLSENTLLYSLVNEGKKIPPSASAVHNITNEMIKNSPSLKNSKPYKFLEQNKDAILVSHNFDFDIFMLSKSGFEFNGDFIDTLRVTKHLIDDLESYSLNYLRYELKLYKNESEILKLYNQKEITPHNAKSDVIVLKLLYNYLLEISSYYNMIELSKKPVFIKKFVFGKYKDRYIEEIANIDIGYIRWLLNQNIDDDLRFTLEKYI